MIVTDDAHLADEARIYRDQGKASFLTNLHTRLGSNWRMSEPHAAIVLTQLRRLDEFIAHRDQAARRYNAALPELGFTPVAVPDGAVTNYYKYIAFLPDGIDRAVLKQRLREEYDVGLSGEVYEMPLHQQPVFEPLGRGPAARRRGALRPPRLPARLGGDHARAGAAGRSRALAGDARHDRPPAGDRHRRLGLHRRHVVDALVAAGHQVRVLDPALPHRDDVEWRPVDMLDLDDRHRGARRQRPGLPPRRDGRRQRRHRRAGPGHRGQRRRDGERARGRPTGRRRPRHPRQHGLGLRRHPGRAGRRDHAVRPRHQPPPLRDHEDRGRDGLPRLPHPLPAAVHRPALRHPVRAAHAGHTVLAAFFQRALAGEPLRIDGDGRQQRNFVYVEDLARAHVLALRPEAENRTSTSTGRSRSRSGGWPS